MSGLYRSNYAPRNNNASSNRNSNTGMSLFGAQNTAASTANPTQGRTLGSNTSASSSDSNTGDLSKDIAVSNPPEDSISHIRFSPATEHLAVASWDKKVRIYEVGQNGNTEGKALFEHDGPALSCCWSQASIEY